MLTTALLISALAASAPVQSGKTAPPGMVLIPGGRTWIGTDEEVVKKLGAESVTKFKNTTRETPLHQMTVDDFYLGVSEVTNEQFLEYVKAAGARPPESWGIDAINEASVKFAAEQGLRIKQAKEQGLPVPPREKFDQTLWWRNNWRDVQWEIPKGRETLPVAYVDYQEATGYARWAGVRLMTEFEYQRAGRGKTKNPFTWGEKWDASKCANQGQGSSVPRHVGQFPGGATEQGIHDLCGNVWEWTASPYVAYPGYKNLQLVVGRGADKDVIDGLNKWDANQRVVVGGSYQMSDLACRLTTRRGTERDQSTDGVGFRIAASIRPGEDIGSAVLRDDLPADKRPEGVEYELAMTVATDRWSSQPGKAEIANYAVITGYDYVLFIPAKELDVASKGQLDGMTLEEGPVHMGALSLTRPTIQPELAPGTYMIAYRGPGKLRPHESVAGSAPPPEKETMRMQDQEPAGGEPEEPAAPEEPGLPPVVYPEGLDPAAASLIFYDVDMKMVGAISGVELDYARPARPVVLIKDGTRRVQARDAEGVLQVDKKGEPVWNELPVIDVMLKVNSLVRVSNKGFTYLLPLKFEKGQVSEDWRH